MLGTIAWITIALTAGFLSMKCSKPAAGFPADCRKVAGTVVGINKAQSELRERLSSVRDLGCLHRPVIEYQSVNRFWFEADLDAQEYDLKVGDQVKVLLANHNPLVARLDVVAAPRSKRSTGLMTIAVATWLAAIYQFTVSASTVTIDNGVVAIVMVTGMLLGFMSKGFKNIGDAADDGLTENAIEVID